MTIDMPPAGWYPAPGEPGLERRWSGSEWTADRREASVTFHAPMAPVKPVLREGQVMLLVFGAIFLLLVLIGLLYPLTVFRSS